MSTEAIDSSTLTREFTRELHNRNAAVFAGAGLSVASGYVDWKGLLKDVMSDLKLDPKVETDLVTVAQYYCNKTYSRAGLTRIIFNHFAETRQPTENHRILARLPIQIYWTTNYDKLIEQALVDAKKVPDVKYTRKQLAVTRPDRDVLVYKMHGDIDHAADAIICKDDYEKYPYVMGEFLSALRGDLIEKTFLFIGFSFTDPNIDYILSRVRARYEEDQRHHYCVLRREAGQRGKTKNQLAYSRRKQEYFIRDMKRFGVQTVLVDDYSEITELLRAIEMQYRLRSIFFSGAADEYGVWKPADAQQFLHDLSYGLSQKKNRIITGFGLGVGGAIINGSLAYLNEAGKTVTDEHILMRPFPQVSTGTKKLAGLWTEYREQMIQYAGIAVFVFGNKRKDGVFVLSDGMRQEFDLCVQAEVHPIPVGATGYMAEELWKEVWNDFKRYYPNASLTFRRSFRKLGDKGKRPEELLAIIRGLVEHLQGG